MSRRRWNKAVHTVSALKRMGAVFFPVSAKNSSSFSCREEFIPTPLTKTSSSPSLNLFLPENDDLMAKKLKSPNLTETTDDLDLSRPSFIGFQRSQSVVEYNKSFSSQTLAKTSVCSMSSNNLDTLNEEYETYYEPSSNKKLLTILEDNSNVINFRTSNNDKVKQEYLHKKEETVKSNIDLSKSQDNCKIRQQNHDCVKVNSNTDKLMATSDKLNVETHTRNVINRQCLPKSELISPNNSQCIDDAHQKSKSSKLSKNRLLVSKPNSEECLEILNLKLEKYPTAKKNLDRLGTIKTDQSIELLEKHDSNSRKFGSNLIKYTEKVNKKRNEQSNNDEKSANKYSCIIEETDIMHAKINSKHENCDMNSNTILLTDKEKSKHISQHDVKTQEFSGKDQTVVQNDTKTLRSKGKVCHTEENTENHQSANQFINSISSNCNWNSSENFQIDLKIRPNCLTSSISTINHSSVNFTDKKCTQNPGRDTKDNPLNNKSFERPRDENCNLSNTKETFLPNAYKERPKSFFETGLQPSPSSSYLINDSNLGNKRNVIEPTGMLSRSKSLAVIGQEIKLSKCTPLNCKERVQWIPPPCDRKSALVDQLLNQFSPNRKSSFVSLRPITETNRCKYKDEPIKPRSIKPYIKINSDGLPKNSGCVITMAKRFTTNS